MNKGDNFTFVIKEHLEVLAIHSTGWKKELNLVEWNGNNPKFDIRDWDEKHESMGRGITMHPAEAKKLCNALNKYFSMEDNKKEDNAEDEK